MARRAATKTKPPAFVDGDAYSVREFCARHRISVAVFYKYPGMMPATFSVGSRRLISREAAAAWRRERENASTTNTTA